MIPFLPFIGMTLLVHILVISLKKSISSKRLRNRMVETAEIKFLPFRYMTTGIIVVTAIIVFSVAGMVVEASIHESHSNAHLAVKLFNKIREIYDFNNFVQPEQVSGTVIKSSKAATALKILPPYKCRMLFEERMASYDYSLVDYLAAQGLPRSLKARQDIAAEFGIKGYTGKPDQNQYLLKRLFVKLEELPGVDCSASIN
jgi:hypothetical protein